MMQTRREFLRSAGLGALALGAGTPRGFGAAGGGSVSFEKIVLSDEFFCDGIGAGDINRDGHMDIVAGPFWYEGPDFKRRHRFYDAEALPMTAAASTNMFTFVHDFDGDGWPDILVCGRLMFTEIFWYQNPGAGGGPWKKHFVFHRLYGESKLFVDVNGDGKPELVGHWNHCWGYLAPDWAHPERPWTFHPITERGNWPEYYHGTGIGDINGDGRMDLVINDGWWEQPAEPGRLWIPHPHRFSPWRGGAQNLIFDVNGDGLNDVVTALDAHGWGLAWFEQVRDRRGNISFIEHKFMGDRSEEARYGAAFSQPHTLCLADINGDGLPDVIAAKRRWAHGPHHDIEPNAPPVIYWFELQRDPVDGVRFVPHLVDDHSGGGVQIATADLNGDGIPDILAGNRLGAFAFITRWTAAAPPLGPGGPPPVRPSRELCLAAGPPRLADGMGRTVAVGDAGIALQWIPAGAFRMGAEAGGADDERPVTLVRITRGFWLGRCPVTQGQWRALTGRNPSEFQDQGDDAPVENVSWFEAMDFCRRLDARERSAGRLPEGYEYRLSTEAEWEYACRAGAVGDEGGDPARGWYLENSGGHPHPVGRKPANAWGLCDLPGDICEWCYDWYGAYPGGEIADPAGPSADPEESNRIYRGGGWGEPAAECRMSHRNRITPGFRGPELGFRLALAPIAPPVHLGHPSADGDA